MATDVPEGAGSAKVAAEIEQKTIRLSALLREIDNHPVPLDVNARSQLDYALEMLSTRIAATRALLHQPDPPS